MSWTVSRRDQQLVRITDRGLRSRLHAVNRDVPEDHPEQLLGHLWTCPGCAMQNDPRHLSCRTCETLKWGVAP